MKDKVVDTGPAGRSLVECLRKDWVKEMHWDLGKGWTKAKELRKDLMMERGLAQLSRRFCSRKAWFALPARTFWRG